MKRFFLATVLIPIAMTISLEHGIAGHNPNQITILYDAFGKKAPDLKKDWGYSALIEYGGRRILFDTGNNAEFLRHNVEALGVSLKNLDFVVLSHRHGDHTSGLTYVLGVNPNVPIYTPYEVSQFGTTILPSIVASVNRHTPTLPIEMHYFDGEHQEPRPSGSPWPAAHFIQIEKNLEVMPGLFLISIVSDTPGTKEMHEVSLAIETPVGLVLVVGCSHPGIERIVEAATSFNPQIYAVFGGFHLLSTPDTEVLRIANSLHDFWNVEHIAPGHCSGLPAFAALRDLYGERYIYAALGSVISLP